MRPSLRAQTAATESAASRRSWRGGEGPCDTPSIHPPVVAHRPSRLHRRNWCLLASRSAMATNHLSRRPHHLVMTPPRCQRTLHCFTVVQPTRSFESQSVWVLMDIRHTIYLSIVRLHQRLKYIRDAIDTISTITASEQTESHHHFHPYTLRLRPLISRPVALPLGTPPGVPRPPGAAPAGGGLESPPDQTAQTAQTWA